MAKITTLDGVTHDVEVGDKVRITTKNGDSSEFTVTVAALGSLESRHNFFGGDCIQSLEVIEKKQIPLPTKDGAIIGHPSVSGWVFYQLNRHGQWWLVDTSVQGNMEKVSESRPSGAIRTLGFEVLYEGRG